MKLRKLARQLAAAAVAGAMALSFCMPALAETWNISNKPEGFAEVYSITVEGTTNGRTVELSGVDTSGDMHSSSCTETTETVLSDSGAVDIELNGRDAPVSVALKELYTTVEKKASTQACVETGGVVSVELRGDNAIHVTKEGVGIAVYNESALTIGGSGTLDVEAPNRGIDVDHGGSFTLKGGILNVTNGGIGMSNGTLQVAGGKLNVTNGGIKMYEGTLQVTSGTLNVTSGGIAAEVGGNLTLDGTGTLNVTNGGIRMYEGTLQVTSGNLIASDTSVEAKQITISGGEVTAKTLKATGGDQKVKLSGSAHVTLTDPLSEEQVLNSFDFTDLTTEGWLSYKLTGEPSPDDDNKNYVVIRGEKVPPAPADTDTGSAPAGDAGGALAAVAIGGAALWGGYEVATRVILHNLLPEGAAIPKTQAQLAVLLWNTAGQPEPANEPAFADVDDTTAKAAQWCTEQGYLNGTFKPDKRVAKYNVIRAWNKAFPKH